MKKSKRFFSFVGVALCAVMLLGSVGTLGSRSHVAEAATSTAINKTYTLDTLKSDVAVGSYLEYGEYPQSYMDDTASQLLRDKLKEEVYDGKLPSENDGVSSVIAARKENSDTEHFSYDENTGYFTVVNEAITSGATSIPVGYKFYEYISGLDTLSKYPIYATSSTTNYTSAGKTFADVRTATKAATQDIITAGTYYVSAVENGQNTYKKCNCSYCKPDSNSTSPCLNTTIQYYSNKNGTTTNMPENYSFSKWLQENTYTFTFETDKVGSIAGYVNEMKESVTFTYNGKGEFYSGDDAPSRKSIDYIISSLSNKGIRNVYQIEVYNINYEKFLGVPTELSYDVRVWALNVQPAYLADYINKYKTGGTPNACLNCYSTHNHGSETPKTDDITINGQTTVSTGSEYDATKTYYFEVKPIKWKITAVNGSELTLQSDIILDSINFNLYPISGGDYNTSYLRNWLNYGSSATDGTINVPSTSKSVAITAPTYEINTTQYRLDYITEQPKKSTAYAADNDGVDFERFVVNESYDDNLANYPTVSKKYESINSTPTFFNMAFYNTVNTAIVGETRGSITDYVAIPEDYNFTLAANEYSDYAVATGLVYKYNTSTTYGSGSTGLVWVRDTQSNGSITNRVARFGATKNAYGSTIVADGKVAEILATSSLNQVNQTAGIVPVITIDVSKLTGISSVLSTSDTVDVSTDGTVVTVGGDLISSTAPTSGTTFKLVSNGGMVSEFGIKNYVVDRTAANHTITVYFTKALPTNVDYLKFIVSGSPIEVYSQSWSYNSNDYKYLAVARESVKGATNEYGGSVILQLPTTNGKSLLDGTFNLQIIAVCTNDDSSYIEKCLADSNIRKGTLATIKPGITENDGTIPLNNKVSNTCYEGEVLELKCSTLTNDSSKKEQFYPQVNVTALKNDGTQGEYTLKDGYIYDSQNKDNRYSYDNDTYQIKSYEPIGTAVGDGSNEKAQVTYTRDGWKYDGNRITNDSTNVVLYSNNFTQSFDVFVGAINTIDTGGSSSDDKAPFANLVSAVMFLQCKNNDGTTIATFDFTESAKNLGLKYNYSTGTFTFEVIINNTYINNFNTIQDLTNKLIVKTYGLGGSEGVSTENTASSEGKWEIGSTSISITGPENVYFIGSNYTNQKKYTITISGIPAGAQDTNGVAIEFVVRNSKFDGFEAPSYNMELTSDKVHYYSASSTITGESTSLGLYKNTADNSEHLNAVSEDANFVKDITANSEFTADLKLKNGYSLLDGSTPEMTFKYSAQVLDNKGYRLAQSGTYSSKIGETTYTTSKYADKTLRLDADGYLMTFDANNNLQYYAKSVGTESAIDEFNNWNGLYIAKYQKVDPDYNGLDKKAQLDAISDLNIISPLLMLNYNESGAGYDSGKLLFIPKITYQGNENLITDLDGNEYKAVYEGKATVKYTLADLTENSEDYKYLMNIFSLDEGITWVSSSGVGNGTDKQNAILQVNAFGFDGNYAIEDYYKTIFNVYDLGKTSGVTAYEQSQAYIANYLASFKNSSYRKANIELYPQGGDEWGVYLDGYVEGTSSSYVNVLMNKSTSEDEQRSSTRDNSTYTLNAIYSRNDLDTTKTDNNIDTWYTQSETKYISTYVFVDKYGYTLKTSKKGNVSGDANGYYCSATNPYSVESISPIRDKESQKKFTPWTIMVDTLIDDLSGKEFTKEIGYDYYEVSSGTKHPSFYNENRQWIYVNLSNNETKAAILNNGTPVFTVKDKNGVEHHYGAQSTGDDAITGDFKLYEMYLENGQYKFYEPYRKASGNYFVTFTRPVTATIIKVTANVAVKTAYYTPSNKDDDDNNVPVPYPNYYKKGDTIIRLTINNVVSDIKFTLTEDTISEHRYPVQFYSSFGGNLRPNGPPDQPSATPLFEAFASPFIEKDKGGKITVDNINRIEELMATVKTKDEEGNLLDVIKFIPYRVNHGNISYYYFTGPIDMVSLNGANDLNIKADGTDYYRNGKKLDPFVEVEGENGISYYKTSDSEDRYYFTDEILQFQGWTLATYSRAAQSEDDSDSKSYAIYNWNADCNELYMTDTGLFIDYGKGNYDYADYYETNALGGFQTNFVNNSVVVALQAVYGAVNLSAEFYDWNMTADDEQSGLEKIYQKDGISYNTTFDTQTIGAVNGASQEHTFNDQPATAYGTNMGWHQKLNDGTSFVENLLSTPDNDVKLNTNFYSTMSALDAALSAYKNGDSLYRIWDNQQFYKGSEAGETFYFKITQNGKQYVAEVYKHFDVESDVITANTKLYKIYETGTAQVTLSGFESNGESIIYNHDGITNVYMGTDLEKTFEISSKYNQIIKTGANVASFIDNLTVQATTRYGTHTIDFQGIFDASNLGVYKDGDYITYNATAHKDSVGTFRYTLLPDIAYIYIENNEIKVSILGVIGNVTIKLTTDENYTISSNTYTLTFPNPSVKVDGKGNAVPYGTFYLVSSDGASYDLKFDDTYATETTVKVLRKDGVTTDYTVKIVKVGDDLVVKFDHGTTILIDFKRNDAFSNYIDLNIDSSRPFSLDGEQTGANRFQNVPAFSADDETPKYQWTLDANISEISKYKIIKAQDNYVLVWNDNLEINTYTITKASTTQYTVNMYNSELESIAEAKDDQDIILEFAVATEYTQFVPILTTIIDGEAYQVMFPHMYEYNTNRRDVFNSKEDQTRVTLTSESYYAYAMGGKYYRIYKDVTTTEPYKTYGYYEIVWNTAESAESGWKTIGYIGYNEAEYKYYFVKLNVSANIADSLVSYDKSAIRANAQEGISWLSNTNIYSVTTSTADTTTDITSNPAYTFVATVDGKTADLTELNHGDNVKITITMNPNYTQTIPQLTFMIGESKYYVSGETIEEIGEPFTFDIDCARNINSQDKWVRQNTIPFGGMNFTIVQTVTIDETYDTNSDIAFMTQAGLYKTSKSNYNELEYRLYTSAVYEISFTITDSFTLVNGEYNANEEGSGADHVKSISYAPNQYVVAFNILVGTNDKGTLNYKEGEYYFQTVSTGNKVINPLDETNGKDIFDNEEIKGYTYIASGNTNDVFKVKSQVSSNTYNAYDFDTEVTRHFILYASYSEETYKTKIVVNEIADTAVKDYGKVSFGNDYLSVAELASNSDLLNAGRQVAYSDTNFAIKFDMASAYTHSSVRYYVSQYGEFLLPGDKDANDNTVSGSYQTSVGKQIIVSRATDENNTQKIIYNYDLNGENIAQIMIEGTSYYLIIVRNIDAGEHETSTIDIEINFVKNTDENETNQSDGKNKYEVVFIKPEWATRTINTVLNNHELIIPGGQTPYSEYSTQTVTEYVAWDTYPTDLSGISQDRIKTIYVVHGNTINLSTSLSTFFTNADIVAGYNFKGWSDGESFEIDYSNGVSRSVEKDYYLFGIYSELTGITLNASTSEFEEEIIAAKSINPSDGFFVAKQVTTTPTTYLSQAKVRFTLNPVFSQTSYLKFASTNAVIEQVTYLSDEGVYEVTLSHFTSTNPQVFIVADGLTVEDITTTAFRIDFVNYGYVSSIDGTTWTEEITINAESITNRQGTSSEVTGLSYNSTLSNQADWGDYFGNHVPQNPTGLEYNGWMYIRYFDNTKEGLIDGSYQETFYNIIKATLNGQLKDYYNYDGVEIFGYQVGKFDLNTLITGNMFVLPYYTRSMVEVNFAQTIEESQTSSSLIDGYAKTFKYNIPYGLPILSDVYQSSDISELIYSSYSYIDTLDDSAKYLGDEHYTFDGYYLNGQFVQAGLYGIVADNTIESISVNFNKNVYLVKIYLSKGDSTPIAEVEVKFSETLSEETKLVAIDNEDSELADPTGGYSTVGRLVANAKVGASQYFKGWRNKDDDTEYPVELVLTGDVVDNINSDVIKIYPYVGYQSYSFKISEGSNFSNYADMKLSVNGQNPTYNGEYFNVSYSDSVKVEYLPTEGYTAAPILTILVNGEEVVSGSTTSEVRNIFMIETSTNETTGYVSITLSGFTADRNYSDLTLANGDLVEIIVNQSINNYDVTIKASDIVVDYSNRTETYTFEEAGRLETAGYNKNNQIEPKRILSFEYETKVSHGQNFTFKVVLDKKYSRLATQTSDAGTIFKFTITDGINTTSYQLKNDGDTEFDQYDNPIYIFKFENVQGEITIDIDEENSRLVQNQFKITYNYLFGGQTNGWLQGIEPNKSVVIEKKDPDFNGMTYDVVATKDTLEYVLENTQLSTDYSNSYVSDGIWYVFKPGRGFNELINANNYDEYFEPFDVNTYSFENYAEDGLVNVFAFYIVKTVTVTPSVTETSKGAFELPTNGNGEYVADVKNEQNTFAKGYTFSYVLNSGYSRNIPVISVVGNSGNIDFIIIDINEIDNITSVKKSNAVTYYITKLTDTSYAYSVQALSGEASTYEVVFNNGKYTILQGGVEVATATLDGLKTTITLNAITDNFTVDVNDDIFEINKYSVEFIKSDGSKEVFELTYGGKLSTIPTEQANFIQKVVYKVTYADGTIETLSSKELEKLEITEDLVIELSVELNLVILIPLVVGAVVVVIIIVVVIAKGVGNSRYKKSSGSSNMAAFDKLNQNRPTSDASKKSDKPYNPYIDNSRDKK